MDSMSGNPAGQNDSEAARPEVKEGEIVSVDAPPIPPKGMSAHEADEIRRQAEQVVKQLGDLMGSKEMEIIDSMSSVGIQSQRTAAGYLDLLKGRVSVLLNEGGPSKDIANSMSDLRMALDQIDPNAPPRTIWDRMYRIFPFFGRHNPVSILQKIALRYEPVSRQVSLIETRLREGRTMLVRDNVELRKTLRAARRAGTGDTQKCVPG